MIRTKRSQLQTSHFQASNNSFLELSLSLWKVSTTRNKKRRERELFFNQFNKQLDKNLAMTKRRHSRQFNHHRYNSVRMLRAHTVRRDALCDIDDLKITKRSLYSLSAHSMNCVLQFEHVKRVKREREKRMYYSMVSIYLCVWYFILHVCGIIQFCSHLCYLQYNQPIYEYECTIGTLYDILYMIYYLVQSYTCTLGSLRTLVHLYI